LTERGCGAQRCAICDRRFELGEAQKIAGMVEFLAGRLGGDFDDF
jgi:hypothetical protein